MPLSTNDDCDERDRQGRLTDHDRAFVRWLVRAVIERRRRERHEREAEAA